MEQTRRKRPWLAAILGALFTGFGHLYLRRWKRALGWVLATITTSFLFVPASTLEAMSASLISGSTSVPPMDLFLDLLPLLAVGVISVLDAYVIALTNNKLLMEQQMGIQRCPQCGKQIDPDVSFCQWCATPQDDNIESEPTER